MNDEPMGSQRSDENGCIWSDYCRTGWYWRDDGIDDHGAPNGDARNGHHPRPPEMARGPMTMVGQLMGHGVSGIVVALVFGAF
jgi:hypothetical protein